MTDSYRKLDKGEVVTQGLASLYLKGSKIYIRLPDKLGLGRNKYVSTGLENLHEGRAKARTILTALNNDILLETFDPSLKRYLPRYRTEAYQKEVQRVIGASTPVQGLWEIYCNFKKGEVKESTLYYLETTIGDKVRELPVKDIYDASSIAKYLTKHTTPDYTLRILRKLKALFDWCVQKKILPSGDNPYVSTIPTGKKGRSVVRPARPLTEKEVNLILNTLPLQYQRVTLFILATGCRPSEAIGLTWENIDHGKGTILLGSSKVKKGGHTFESETSKNNKVREFPITRRVSEVLDCYCPYTEKKGLVFTNTIGTLIDYSNYLSAWKEIIPDSTPYSARDTFITRQVELGKPVTTIAAWVDNSVEVIEKHYYKPTGKVLPE